MTQEEGMCLCLLSSSVDACEFICVRVVCLIVRMVCVSVCLCVCACVFCT